MLQSSQDEDTSLLVAVQWQWFRVEVDLMHLKIVRKEKKR